MKFKSFFFVFKKNKAAVISLIAILILLFVAVFAKQIAPYEADAIDISNTFAPPSLKHLMGTDNFGRDIFTRIIIGAKISLKIGLISVFVAMTTGVILGSFSGYYGGILDQVIMRIMDVLLSIPQLILAIALAAALGNGMKNLIIAVSISAIPRYARIVRSSVLDVKGKEFIEACVLQGSSNTSILFKEILPNAFAPIIVEATIGVGTSILSAASLSFIGMGIMPPAPEWGQMLSEGRAYIRDYPFMTLFPGLFIALTILFLNILGDGLRDALDPKMGR